ncbi:hypothetical protein CsSME_00027095 [Camellia sinensis var. sinensis]
MCGPTGLLVCLNRIQINQGLTTIPSGVNSF